MDAEDIPPELWMEIFELLPLPSDLYSVMCTCRRFHDLVIRTIHRHVIWKTPQQVAHNLPLWNLHEGMNTAIHTLELGVSSLPVKIPGFVVDLSGQSFWQEHNDEIGPNAHLCNTIAYHRLDRQHFASSSLHNAMFTRVRSFINLESLILTNLLLSKDHFTTIHALSQLRRLSIEFCIIPGRDVGRHLDHRTLPITDLAMLNLRRRVSADHFEVLVEEDISHLLTLALAHDLRTLRVDSTADVFRNVFHGWRAEALGHTIPSKLERLYIQRKQIQQPAFAGEATFPDATFYSFLSRATSLITYSTYHPIPQYQHLQQRALPLLRQYSGPVDSIMSVVSGRPLEALRLLQCTHGQHGVVNNRDGIPALTTIAESFPNLQMLAVEFSRWDDEIVHAVTTLFHDLKRLKIVCETGGPSEAFLGRMGPEHLARLLNLHTLQMYTLRTPDGPKPDHPSWLFDSSFTSIEEELRDLVIPWNRWCPALREVQLLSGYTMRRGFSGGRWDLLRIKRLSEVEEFSY